MIEVSYEHTTGRVAAAKLLTDAKTSRKVHQNAVTGIPERKRSFEKLEKLLAVTFVSKEYLEELDRKRWNELNGLNDCDQVDGKLSLIFMIKTIWSNTYSISLI